MARTPRRANLKADAVHPADSAQARYDAAGDGRRYVGWRTPNAGPNLALKGLQNVRNRGRDIDRNDWAGRSITRNWVTTLIGIGIRARFPQIKNEERQQLVSDWFEQFMRECDADGVSHWFAMQTIAVRSWFTAGEVFVRERPRDLSLPLLIPVQYQMLEAEMLPLLDADQWPGMPQGNRMVSGIELNRYDRRIAYWFYKNRPNDGQLLSRAGYDDLVRVPASQVWHVYEPERAGQMRGVSNAASVIARLRMAGDFEDAVLDRQRLANLFTMFITKNLPTEFWNGAQVDPITGMPKCWAGGKENQVSLEPGMGVELKPGEQVTFANPPEAGTTYAEYMRYTHVGSAAGGGLPYELMSGDIKDVSDRTLRVVMNQFYRLAEQKQWQILVPKLCQPFVEGFARYAALKGLLRASEVALVSKCTHAPHAWAYIHPVQDVQAEALKVASGFKARSDVIQEQGEDPLQVDRRRADDRKREDTLGLNDLTPAQKATQQQRQGQKQQQQQQQANNEATHRQIEARHASAFEALAAAASRPVEAPTINVAAPVVNVAPPNVSVNVEPGAAPTVQVDNHVPAQEPPIVNVTSPTVQVDNHVPAQEPPIVNVAPAQVTVENKVENPPVKVELPTRKTTSVISRDEQGNIKTVTQTEKTVE